MTVPLAAEPTVVRARLDAAWVALGAVLLVLSALPVDEHSLSGAERSVFRAVNQVPGIPFTPVWLLMQAGNVAAVPLAAVAALVARRRRLAASLAVAGALAYGGAKLVKEFVTRGRPMTLLEDVEIHGAAAQGLGFVSGHAGVIVALAVVAFPYLGPRARWAVAALAVFVSVARVYVGAHLPLDVVGGAGLGLLVGGVVRLIFARPAPCS